MSQKITSKNLQYTQNLPPFLAALRGQAPANCDAPDPILAAQRRPVKKRTGSEEAEDAPLVLDEAGNEVAGVKIGVDGAVKDGGEVAGSGEQGEGDEKEGGAQNIDGEKLKVAGIGGGKKRKVGKIIGGDDEERVEKDEEKSQGEAKSTKDDEGKKPVKSKKKAKKVKLSFGDGDGD